MSFSPLGVEVGLKTTYQIVRENESPALVCAVVDSPDEDNPSSVSFPLDIHFHELGIVQVGNILHNLCRF